VVGCLSDAVSAQPGYTSPLIYTLRSRIFIITLTPSFTLRIAFKGSRRAPVLYSIIRSAARTSQKRKTSVDRAACGGTYQIGFLVQSRRDMCGEIWRRRLSPPVSKFCRKSTMCWDIAKRDGGRVWRILAAPWLVHHCTCRGGSV
jgi:hypothetical protein